eukprot:SAG31_NODE_1850_length_7082_cov_7.264786_3_plen_451_part_00
MSQQAAPTATEIDKILTASGRSERLLAYSLIGGQIFSNYVPRLAIPSVVPFLVREFNFTDQQRAGLLGAFVPGYVLTQIPGAPLTGKFGPVAMLCFNNIGSCVALLMLPAAAASRFGNAAVWLCFATLGIMQGLFIAPQAAMTSNWVPQGPERPLGVFIIRLGGNLAKLLASALTPILCASRIGWRAVPWVYGGGVMLYLVIFRILARDSPHSVSHKLRRPEKQRSPAEIPRRQARFRVMQLFVRPTLATLAVQVAHMLCEYNIVTSWAPTYFHEVLGVPLGGQLGVLTSLPVVIGIASKSVIASWESLLLRRNISQLALRKLATSVGSAISCCCLVLFNRTRSRYFASLLYGGIVVGNSFDYSGFLPNFIELAGDDPSGSFYAWLNTFGWAVSHIVAEGINKLATLQGKRDWNVVWLSPVAWRIAATLLYLRWASIRPAQEHLDGHVKS